MHFQFFRTAFLIMDKNEFTVIINVFETLMGQKKQNTKILSKYVTFILLRCVELARFISKALIYRRVYHVHSITDSKPREA